jgi:hypothetical protein
MKKLSLLTILLCGVQVGHAANDSKPQLTTPTVSTTTPPAPVAAIPTPPAPKALPTPPAVGAKPGSSMPAMPPISPVQLKVLETMGKVSSKLGDQAGMEQAVQAVQDALEKGLASKDFSKGFNNLTLAIEQMFQAVGSNVVADQDLLAKLKDAANVATEDLSALTKSNIITAHTQESYLIKVVNSAAAGFKKGLATVKAQAATASKAKTAPAALPAAKK